MKLLLIEDHPIFRGGLRQAILGRWPDAAIDEAGSIAEGLELIARGGYRLVLADLNLPDSSGLETVTRLRRAAPDLPLLILSLNTEAVYAERALKMGAAGYLTKDRAAEDLLVALERVLAGGRYISAALAEYITDRLTGQRTARLHADLSQQEYRVLVMLAEGRRPGDIAETMHLSPKTVSTYRTRVLAKLGMASNAELTRYCLAHRLIEPLPPL